jgi:hypothetical protein
MTHDSALDKLEEGIVFRVSRSFFLVLVLIAMLGVVAAVFYLLWAITPTTKDTVTRDPDPKPVLLTTKDIKEAMNKPKVTRGETATTTAEAKTSEKTEADQNQLKFQSLLDTLRILLPSRLYSWQSSGYWTYPYGREMYNYYQKEDYRKWNVTEAGITDKLKEFYVGVSEYKEAIAPLEQLCKVLREFPEDQRLAPFTTFMDLYIERQAEYKRRLNENEESYQSRVSEANAKYESTTASKAVAKYQSLIAVGSGITSVAFLAIFLVLLSVQRNIKKLAIHNEPN